MGEMDSTNLCGRGMFCSIVTALVIVVVLSDVALCGC